MCASISLGSFKNNLGIHVFYKIWKPKETKVNVVFCHGHSEHVSRYSDIFTRFAGNGIKVLAFDQVGYGETGMKMNDLGGARGAEQLLLDMTKAIDEIHKPGVPLFLMGHSFGGLGVLNYLSRGKKRELVHGGITSAPCLVPGRAAPPLVLQMLIVIFSYIIPLLEIKVSVKWEDLSRSESTQEKLTNDPLVTFNSTLIQLRDLALGSLKLFLGGYKSINVPNLLLVHGAKDAVISYGATASLVEKLNKNGRIPNLEMKTLPEAHHDRKSFSKLS
ncbi:hypothetical protein DSO57_1037787 [Entomophthora muscae]|uniref:Uncharacterized protein n=1 Tax=Entomophthora muscae TaxID=34485 RepID=A0ACC2TKK9_9FUNG|nr:hypothetical protein DSO57_1037787 [Entomophthora muscae]